MSERNKQRIKLKDFGYLGLVCFLEDIPVTMTTVRCLYEQVLATGNDNPVVNLWSRSFETDERQCSFKHIGIHVKESDIQSIIHQNSSVSDTNYHIG